MKKLTINQTNIIKNLKSEFERINTPNPGSNGLIDVESIMTDYNKKEAWIKEIDSANEAHDQLIIDLRNESIKTVESDLDNLGMKIKASTYSGGGTFIISSKIKGLVPTYVYGAFENSHYRDVQHGSISLRIRSGSRIVLKDYDNSYFSTSFETFEEMAKSEEFKKKIAKLYAKIQKERHG